MRRVLAPGKLVVLGEYAVLDGAPAIVAAIDRGVRCELGPGDGIVTPGDDRFVRAALRGAPPGRYTFSDWNPVDLPGKPGFGGSAAAVVAAVLAAGLPRERAYAIHAEVQGGGTGGGGSGVDVFASLHGGVKVFPTGEERPCPFLVAVWSGRSALTGPRVARYRQHRGRDAFVRESEACVAGFATEPFEAVREAYRRLCAMAAAAGLDYDTEEHRRIAALADEHGGAAKPSGAGGGDVAVALFPDPAARSAFAEACRRAGLAPIAVEVAAGAGESAAGAGESAAGA